MLHAQSITVKGFNDYVDTLDKDATVSVARFASPYGLKRIHTNVLPGRAKITSEDYPCVGGTPLYDAIGTSIQEGYAYPDADRLFNQYHIHLIKGDGRILFVENCTDRTARHRSSIHY